jgi:hypothetical protein
VQTYQYQSPAVVETITVNEMVSGSKVVPLPPREGHTMRVSFADVPYTTSFTNNNTNAAVGSNMISQQQFAESEETADTSDPSSVQWGTDELRSAPVSLIIYFLYR